MTQSLLTTFWEFIKNPSSHNTSSNNLSNTNFLSKIIILVRLWAIAILGNIMMLVLGQGALNLLGSPIDTSKNTVVEFTQTTPALVVILMVAVFAPIYEELTFRLWLRRENGENNPKIMNETDTIETPKKGTLELAPDNPNNKPKFINKLFGTIKKLLTQNIVARFLQKLILVILNFVGLYPNKFWRFNFGLFLFLLFMFQTIFSEDQVKGFFGFIKQSIFDNQIISEQLWILFLVIAQIVIILGFNKLIGLSFAQKLIGKIYSSSYNWLFWFATIGFGLAHISNYRDISGLAWLATPLLILPQLLTGTILGFIRVNFGLRWSMFFHSLFNGILAVPLLAITFTKDDPNLENPASKIATTVIGLVFLGMIIAVIGINIWNVIDTLGNNGKKATKSRELLKF